MSEIYLGSMILSRLSFPGSRKFNVPCLKTILEITEEASGEEGDRGSEDGLHLLRYVEAQRHTEDMDPYSISYIYSDEPKSDKGFRTILHLSGVGSLLGTLLNYLFLFHQKSIKK